MALRLPRCFRNCGTVARLVHAPAVLRLSSLDAARRKVLWQCRSIAKKVWKQRKGLEFLVKFVPQKQNAMGSLHNIDFGVFWASWGGSGKEPGSGNRFQELVPGNSSGNRIRVSMVLRFQGSGSAGCVKEESKVSVFDGFRGVRFYSRGFDGTVSGNRVPGTRGTKKVPGQGFRQLLCTSKVYYCTLKVYFCTLKVYLLCFASILFYVESMLLCFESIILYLESMRLYVESTFLQFESALLYVESILWKYAFVLWQYTFVLWKYAFVLWEYSFVNWKHNFVLWNYGFVLWTYTFVLSKCTFGRWKYTCCTLQIYFCTLPQCLSKEKVVINSFTLQMQTSLLLGIPPTLIFFLFACLGCMFTGVWKNMNGKPNGWGCSTWNIRFLVIFFVCYSMSGPAIGWRWIRCWYALLNRISLPWTTIKCSCFLPFWKPTVMWYCTHG